MPWRGPEFPGEFPTLGYIVADFIEAYCVIPDRAVAGQPFRLSDEQLNHLLWQFRLKPSARPNLDKPAAAFAYVGDLIVRSQKWGKGPFSAARICAMGIGPVLFDGWDANGEPVGRPWVTPHIQVAAVAEDQTDNIWRALKPMIEIGPLADEIPDTGLDRINLPDGGIIEPVSSNATTRLGARITGLEIDQPESMTKANGGEKLVDTLLRNLAGMGGRWSATGNAHDPSENSVQQTWIEKPTPDVYIDYPDPLEGSWGNKRERRRILKHAYKGSPWVDLNRIEADCARLDAKGDPGQAERFFGNRVVAGADKAFDIETFKSLRDDEESIPDGAAVTLGFDGALTRDATGLVVTDIATGRIEVVGVWERPPHLQDDEPWMVPVADVDDAVADAFNRWNVYLLYGDPPHWKDDLQRWMGQFGNDRVVLFWTNLRKKMAYSLKAFKTDMRDGVMSYGGRFADRLELHIANAIKNPTAMKDEDDGTPLWLISKDGHNSPRKIDLAMAACLSWEARGAAIAKGALNEPEYESAQW